MDGGPALGVVPSPVVMADSPPQTGPVGEPDLIAPGTIDRESRPIVFNADGSISTERSFSVGLDEGNVLLPSIVNGKEVSMDAAIAHYRQTGEHLGIFRTPAAADAYAHRTHDALARHYRGLLRRGKPGED